MQAWAYDQEAARKAKEIAKAEKAGKALPEIAATTERKGTNCKADDNTLLSGHVFDTSAAADMWELSSSDDDSADERGAAEIEAAEAQKERDRFEKQAALKDESRSAFNNWMTKDIDWGRNSQH